MAISLKYHFHAQSSYVLGKPIIIGFTLESEAQTDLWILKWYTPLEGIKGKILQVTCDGEELPYQGIMMKRGNPRKEHYVLLHPGGSASAEFDLSEHFPLRKCDECRVDFKGRIHDVVLDPQQLPSTSDKHTSLTASGTPVSFRIENQLAVTG
jgi:hypothetical protein